MAKSNKKNQNLVKNYGAWLGGNKGYVLSGSNTDTSAKADAGGGQAEAVRGELGLGAYAAGVGAAGAIGAGVAAARSGLRAYNAPKGDLESLRGLYHGTSQKLKPGTVIRPRADLGVKETWTGAKSNPNVAYATPYADFAQKSATTSRMTRMNELGFGGGGVSPRTDTVVPTRRGPVTKKVDPRVGGVIETNPMAYNKAVRQTRTRVYEVVPVNPSTVKVQKIDKIREYVSPEGFIVKGEVYRGSVYNQTFPRSPSRIGSAIRSKLPKRK